MSVPKFHWEALPGAAESRADLLATTEASAIPALSGIADKQRGLRVGAPRLLRSAFFTYPVPRTGTESARPITGVGKLAVL
jgi:hypothetical protein